MQPTEFPHKPPVALALIAFLLLLGCALPTIAETIYRCGNTYSKVPCDNATTITAPSTNPQSNDDAPSDHVCIRGLKRFVSFKDPDSVKIETMTHEANWKLIEIGSKKIAVKAFYLWVNAKNSYGGYAGSKMYTCYVSEATGQVLRVSEPSS